MFLRELLCHAAQHCVIIGFPVVRHSRPINGFRGAAGVLAFFKNTVVVFFRLSPPLAGKGDTAKGERQLCRKFLPRQITFNAISLLAGTVEKYHAWSPERIEAMKIGRRFFDVDGDGKKILIDETCELVVAV